MKNFNEKSPAPESATEQVEEETDSQFEAKSLDWLEDLRKKGASAETMLEGLAGLDSERAWQLRDELSKIYLDNSHYLMLDIEAALGSSLVGLESERAWQLRSKIMNRDHKGVPRHDKIMASLTGLDSERDWSLRNEHLNSNDNVLPGMAIESLAGNNSEDAWATRDRAENKQNNAKSIIASLAGLDSDEAWTKRNKAVETDLLGMFPYLAHSLAGLDSERAWELRDKLNNFNKKEGDSEELKINPWVCESLVGVDSEQAWEMRQTSIKQGRADAAAYSLAGLNTEQAWTMRKLIEENDDDNCFTARGLVSNNLMAAVYKARKDQEQGE